MRVITHCHFPAGVYIRFKPRSGKGFVYSDRILGEKCGSIHSKINITIVYRVKKTYDPRSLVYPFYLNPHS